MGHKKNHATPRDKKITLSLGENKSYNLSEPKGIMQPPVKKKITQPLGTKKNATSQNKQKTQLLRTKKKLRYLLGQKKNYLTFRGGKSHATSWGKKS